MSVVLSGQPGFTEIPAAAFNTGVAITQADIVQLNSNVNFSVARNEQFWGFYKHGETIQLPVSPEDGYAYALNELLFTWSIFSTAGAPAGALLGTHTTPTPGATTGDGTVLYINANVDQATGAVAITIGYYKTSQEDRNDGILMVVIHAQRQR